METKWFFVNKKCSDPDLNHAKIQADERKGGRKECKGTKNVVTCYKEYCCVHCTVGSSDFPRSLCFMWFWFGLEILRLVYKKAFFKILIGFYLIWAFNFQKNSTVPYKSWKKFLRNLPCRVSKKRNFALISKMCRTLASRSSQRFILRKMFFCKIFQVPKN